MVVVGDGCRWRRWSVVGGAVVGGGVVGGAVGVHSSSETCADVAPSVTVTWQVLDWKLGDNNRNLPSSSALPLADDSAEVTHTTASGTAPSPSTLRRPSSSSARSMMIESSAFTATTSSDADMPASATPTVISRAPLATGLLIAPPPTTHRGAPLTMITTNDGLERIAVARRSGQCAARRRPPGRARTLAVTDPTSTGCI